MDANHVIGILTATLDPAHQEEAGKKLDEVNLCDCHNTYTNIHVVSLS